MRGGLPAAIPNTDRSLIVNFLQWLWRTPVTWRAWQFVVLRWCLLALGVILGAAFADFWQPFLWPLGVVFAVTAVWTGVMYFRGMPRSAPAVTAPARQEFPC
jgi:hypothetical protein